MKYTQQGDVLVKPVASIPDGAVELTHTTLKESQVTKHAHRAVGAVKAFSHKGMTYLQAVEPFRLEHEEHKTLEIPAGQYVVEEVLEYDHFAEEARAVAD